MLETVNIGSDFRVYYKDKINFGINIMLMKLEKIHVILANLFTLRYIH